MKPNILYTDPKASQEILEQQESALAALKSAGIPFEEVQVQRDPERCWTPSLYVPELGSFMEGRADIEMYIRGTQKKREGEAETA